MVANRLQRESSPYLLQHADNPVDWHPWGDEAFEKAQREDKPIFLSIGYSACHWCHVMARESFDDPEIARILNDSFVSVKVDREERPELDRIYMSAVQAMTGSGGWPMSVFLAPDGRPFFGGTYFPPRASHGLPSFKRVITTVAGAWENRRSELLEGSDRVVAAIQREMSAAEADDELRASILSQALLTLRRDFDKKYGGWDGAPKFPQPMIIEFLLRLHHSTGEPEALGMAVGSLDAMARGGIYDQLGGGFHRYGVDRHWTVPHFEKMLYDNALLARVYLHAWQVTEKPLFRAIVEETLDYVVREMQDDRGGFYATQSAETENEEGRFFVWTKNQIEDVLGDDTEAFAEAYDVRPGGNWEGKNILTFTGTWQERQGLADARQQLVAARDKRVRPERDDKVLTSWNGLMLAAFAEAGRVLRREDYLQVARRNAEFLLDALRADDGHLLHTWRDGEANIRGYLDDYANVVDGLLALHQATHHPHWFQEARQLTERMLAHFRAPTAGFFDTSDAHEQLITRPRSLQDNAVPSGNAMAVLNLLRLSHLAVEPTYDEVARRSLSQVQSMMGRYPLGFGQWLTAMEYALAETREIAIVGVRGSPGVQALLDVCEDGFRPHQMIAVGLPDTEGTERLPLLSNRPPIDEQATAYVCVDSTCRQPVTDPEELKRLL